MRIGHTAKSIGARATITNEKAKQTEQAQPETVEQAQPETVEVADAQPGETPAAKADQPKKAEVVAETQHVDVQVNIAAIIGGVSAALAALGIGAAFLAMR